MLNSTSPQGLRRLAAVFFDVFRLGFFGAVAAILTARRAHDTSSSASSSTSTGIVKYDMLTSGLSAYGRNGFMPRDSYSVRVSSPTLKKSVSSSIKPKNTPSQYSPTAPNMRRDVMRPV